MRQRTGPDLQRTGHITQEDPIGLAGGLNLYGFAAADPVNFSDPFGLCPQCLTGRPWGGAVDLAAGPGCFPEKFISVIRDAVARGAFQGE
ncbi:MAG: RHS repeat-associated core domain-containing protein [Longimicrobiales bacterium]